jgi:hypothetical protein
MGEDQRFRLIVQVLAQWAQWAETHNLYLEAVELADLPRILEDPVYLITLFSDLIMSENPTRAVRCDEWERLADPTTSSTSPAAFPMSKGLRGFIESNWVARSTACASLGMRIRTSRQFLVVR